ncbi:hypothetical protein BBP40_011960 [Aspergillus hancockii]|nr:hypothetical protein BBP40_011960 [Aspergillus hancockii]
MTSTMIANPLKRIVGPESRKQIAVQALDPFPFEGFTDELHNKTKYDYLVRGMFNDIPVSPQFPPDDPEWHDPKLAGLIATSQFHRLAIASVSHSVLSVSNDLEKDDVRHVKNYIDPTAAGLRYGEAMSNLMSFGLAAHIGRKLKSICQRSLPDLHELTGFFDYAKEQMLSDQFIDASVDWDDAKENHLFSISMLLIADYLQKDPQSIPAYGPYYWERASYEILKAWSQRIHDTQTKGDDQKTDQLVQFGGRAASITFCPATGNDIVKPTATFEVMNGFYASILSSQDATATPTETEYKQAVAASLQRLSGAEGIVNEWKTYSETLEDKYKTLKTGLWQEAVDATYTKCNWCALYEWAHDSWYSEKSLYQENPYELVFLNEPPSRPSDCSQQYLSIVEPSLQPNLQVECTSSENYPVQQTDEDFCLLELSDSPESKSMPDNVPTHQKLATLIGFNREPPFAVPTQVFHTTSGSRAVDFNAAQASNPHENIGRLAVGHVLFRWNSGNQRYDHIEIGSIEQTPTSMEGLDIGSIHELTHLRHANGYLVSENSPDHTLKSIANLVRDLPVRERLAYLRTCPELAATFATNDIFTLQKRLNLELFGETSAPGEEGLLLGKELLDWSSLPTSVYTRHRSNRNGISLDKLQKHYYLSADHPGRPLPPGYRFPELSIVDGCIIADGEVEIRSTFDSHARTFRWTRELPRPQQVEHGLFQVHADGTRGTGVIYLTLELDPCKLVREGLHPFHAAVTQKHELKTGFNPSHTIKTTVDRDAWPAESDFHQPTNPMDGVEIELGTYLTEEGYQFTNVQVPVLDKLQQQLNSKTGKDLESFYRATCTTTKTAIEATVTFHRAPLIPFISNAGLDVDVFDVDFQSTVGIDLTLPVLFQELVVELDEFFYDTTGALYEYEPGVRAAKGTRHIVVGEESDSSRQAFFNALRAKVSFAYAPYSKPGAVNALNDVPERQPAKITKRLLNERDPDIDDLINLTGYEDQSVHDASQTLINDAMFYHMDDDDRENFTSRGKPTTLPDSLASGLSQSIKNFLHDKYAPAYLCRSVVTTEKYESKFTDKERKKLWYWWEGNGDNCLAKSKEYSDLSNLATIEAVKQMHRSTLDKFLNNDPKGWADKMVTTLQRGPVMDQFMANPIREQQNVINKQCCIMNTLSPVSDAADKWFQNMVLYAHNIGLEHPYIHRDEAVAEKWLQESLHSLITKTIQGDEDIAGAVQAELLEDIRGFEEANDLDQGKSAKERATQMVDVMSPVTAEAKTWFTAVDNDVQKAWAGARLYQWLTISWEKISDKVGSTINGSKLLKGLITSSMAAFFLGLGIWKISGLIMDWEKLSDPKRAQVILETLKIATKGVDNAIDTWKVWKGRTASVDLDQLDVALMDQGAYRALNDSGEELVSMADDVNGSKGSWRHSVGDHVSDEGVPLEEPGGSRWNEPIDETPEGLPPAAESTAKELSLTGKILKGVNAFLGLGAAIAMAFSLINDWGSMSTVDKVINTLALVVTTLTVVLDLVDFGATVGLFAVTTIPVLGQVLAAIGIILAIISFFIHLFSPPQPPPPDPIATFIDKKGKPLISSFDDCQDPQLSYDINTESVSPGLTASIAVTAYNSTGNDISMTNITVKILTGDNGNCLFSDADELILVPDNDPNKDRPGHVYITPASNGDGTLPRSDRIGTDHYYHQQNLKVAGSKEANDNALGKFILKAGQSIKAVWTATVYREKGSSLINVVENWGKDKSHWEVRVHRGESSEPGWMPRMSYCLVA